MQGEEERSNIEKSKKIGLYRLGIDLFMPSAGLYRMTFLKSVFPRSLPASDTA